MLDTNLGFLFISSTPFENHSSRFVGGCHSCFSRVNLSANLRKPDIPKPFNIANSFGCFSAIRCMTKYVPPGEFNTIGCTADGLGATGAAGTFSGTVTIFCTGGAMFGWCFLNHVSHSCTFWLSFSCSIFISSIFSLFR